MDSRPLARTRNPRGHGRRLRGEILFAARSLLEGGSAESVTLRSVARQVGISAPSIYSHFSSRDAIIQTIVEEAFAELEEALDVGDDLAPTAQLQAVCEAYLRFAEQRPQRYQLMFGGLWDAAAVRADSGQPPEFSSLGLGAMRHVTDVLRRCTRGGTSRASSVSDEAVMLWVALHGLAELRRNAPLFPWTETIARDLIKRVTRLD